METPTLEQELEALALGSDYRLALRDTGYGLFVEVIFVPAFQAVDMGGRLPLVTNSGVIGHKSFSGWRRWKRARKFVRRTIAGHRQLLLVSGITQVR